MKPGGVYAVGGGDGQKGEGEITVILAEEVIPEADLRAAIDPTGYTVTSYAVEDAKKKGLFGF